MAATTMPQKRGKKQRAKGQGKKVALFGAAAATAVAMTMGGAATSSMVPAASALDLDATTTGPLLGLLDALGITSVDLNVPVLGDVTANLDFVPSYDGLASNAAAIYDAVNAPGFTQFPLTRNFVRPNSLAVLGGGTIAPVLIASGQGTQVALEAYKALLASANGNTPAGYTALTPRGLVTIGGTPCGSPSISCAQGTNITNLALVLVRNAGTPNGGIYARFGPVLNLFGIDPVSPTGQRGQSTGIQFNGGLINVALAYDFVSDAPVTLNPVSWANSVLAATLPTYLLPVLDDIPGSIQGANLTSIIGSLAGLLTANSPFTTYSAILSPDLPLLEPLRLPGRLFNLASQLLGSDLRIRTPLADALQPAAEILVNIGYTDVQTPTEGGTYNRTWDQFGTYTPFLSKAPLTGAELLKVPGDVVKALIDGTVASIENVLENGLFYRADPPPVSAVPASVAASLKTGPAIQDNEAGSATASSVREQLAADDSDEGSDEGSAGGSSTGGSNSGGGSHSGGSSNGNGAQAGAPSGGKSGSHGLGGSKRAAVKAAAKAAASEKAAS